MVEGSGAGLYGWMKWPGLMATIGVFDSGDQERTLLTVSEESIRGVLPGTDEGSRVEDQDQHATEAPPMPKLLVHTR